MSHSFSFEAEGLILHRYPFQSSILVKFLTAEAGILPAVVKQLGRKGSKQMIIQPFSWVSGEVSGRGEVKTLKHIEVAENLAPRSYKCLCAALYLNELVLMFVKAGEIYSSLLPTLRESIQMLSDSALEPHLRNFELYLMELIGYGLPITHDEEGSVISPHFLYRCLPGLRPQQVKDEKSRGVGLVLSGDILAGIHQRDWKNPVCLKQAKLLLRQWIDYYAQGKAFKSRELFKTLPPAHHKVIS